MNVLKKIKKSILLVVINNLLTGTHFFEIKWFLLNQCEGISIGKKYQSCSSDLHTYI